jgi:hypothetical protein
MGQSGIMVWACLLLERRGSVFGATIDENWMYRVPCQDCLMAKCQRCVRVMGIE